MIKQLKLILNKLLTYILPLLGGLLGAIGGSGDKGARRIVLPILIMGLAYLETESILTLTILSLIIPLSIGYGIPDSFDGGSFLGCLFMDITNNEFWANILVRGTVGLVIGLSLISIPIIKKTWLPYILCSLSICMVNALLSWRNFGSFNLFGRTLSFVEFIVWTLITLLSVLIIKL